MLGVLWAVSGIKGWGGGGEIFGTHIFYLIFSTRGSTLQNVLITITSVQRDPLSVDTHNWCTFQYPSWVNLSGPSLDCTANLQLLKRRQACV